MLAEVPPEEHLGVVSRLVERGPSVVRRSDIMIRVR